MRRQRVRGCVPIPFGTTAPAPAHLPKARDQHAVRTRPAGHRGHRRPVRHGRRHQGDGGPLSGLPGHVPAVRLRQPRRGLRGRCRPGWPTREAARANAMRSVVAVLTACSFFYALGELPLAETLILSFLRRPSSPSSACSSSRSRSTRASSGHSPSVSSGPSSSCSAARGRSGAPILDRHCGGARLGGVLCLVGRAAAAAPSATRSCTSSSFRTSVRWC